MALGLYPGTAEPGPTHDRQIDEIADLGATHVALVVSGSQDDVRATAIARPRDVTVADAVLVRAIRHARARGLDVIVFPILTLRRTRTGEWRGTLAPRDWSAWWKSYDRFLLHYARIAAAEHAAALVVGSELGSTEGFRERWYAQIARVERVFAGDIIYSANWDHFDKVSFWRRLDVFGVTGYFELTTDRDADAATLTRAWQRARDRIIRAHAAMKGPRLWLSEVGYVSRDGAATRPWDYNLRSSIDLEEQRRCYAALAAAWRGIDALDGIVMWNWFGTGGAHDGGYTPKGKPAERVLRQWWN